MDVAKFSTQFLLKDVNRRIKQEWSPSLVKSMRSFCFLKAQQDIVRKLSCASYFVPVSVCLCVSSYHTMALKAPSCMCRQQEG